MGYLLVFRKERFWRIETPSGKYTKIGAPNWMPLAGLGALGEFGYALERDCLFRVDLRGFFEIIGRKDEYRRSSAVCALGDQLYVVSDERLWRVNPNDGRYETVGPMGAWPGRVIMTTVEGKLWIVQSEKLWEVDPESGDWTALCGPYGYFDTTDACAWKDHFYVIRRGFLREVRRRDMKERHVLDDQIRGEALLAANDDGIFMIHKLDLFRIDPVKRDVTRLSQGRDWDQVTHMVAFPDLDVDLTPPRRGAGPSPAAKPAGE